MLGFGAWASGTVVKNPPASAGDTRDAGSVPRWGRSPGEGKGNPLQYFHGEFHGQKTLAGYSPWGCKESDMTERALKHTHTRALL